MKIRKYIFKFIDHDNKTKHIAEFDVHSSKISEWTQNENDVEGFVQWMSQHARREMTLKNHIKSIVQDKVLALQNKNFGDYRVVKQKMNKDSVSVNISNNQPSDENRFRQVKLMEKYITKYERGTKPNNWLDVLDYKVTDEHYIYFLADDMSDRIDLRPLRQEGDKFIIPQLNNESATTKTYNNNIMNVRNNTTVANTFSRNNTANINTGVSGATNANANTIMQYVPTSRPGYTTGTNLATAVRTNNVLNRNIGTTAINTANPTANTLIGQTGGDDDYQDKYIKYKKYKKKYIDLKNNKVIY